ncbi:MAG TPA: hypothetical protein PLQ67_05985, partial [Burkholderiaceae bacterium]|nr:hypothetical protein [Burkholderiaceae bacterium]
MPLGPPNLNARRPGSPRTSTLTQSLQYQYSTPSGQRLHLIYPSGKILSYRYAPASQTLEAISFDGQRVAEQIRWHPSLTQGPAAPSSMLLANAARWTSRLDTYGRVVSYTLGGQELNLAWDHLNRLIAQTSTVSAQNQSYTYDPLDRLIGFDSPGRNQRFVYDMNGNLLDKTDRIGQNPEQRYPYRIEPDSNRLTQIENLGIGYGFDAAGNRTQTPSLTHTYDARGRLIKTVAAQGGRSKVYHYLINALGQRVAKLGPEGTTVFAYDQDGQLIGEYDTQGRAQAEYIWLPTQNGAGPTYRPIAVVQ